eukprot:4187201-Lingulodinium_polyedra.AAC.1
MATEWADPAQQIGKQAKASSVWGCTFRATTRTQLRVATESPAACFAANEKYCMRSARRGPLRSFARSSTK